MVSVAVPRLHGLLGCVILVVAFSHTGRPARAQSLVDAARLARARTEKLGTPAKVYTNDDLPHTKRIAEPSLAWAARYRSLLEAALERERALLELRREQPVILPAPVPVQAVPPDPAPTPPAFGIPWYLVSSGYPVFVAAPPDPRPRHSTMVSASPRRQRGRSRVRNHRSRIRSQRVRATPARRVDPSARRPAARNGHPQSSRPLPYLARSPSARRGSVPNPRPAYSSLKHTTVLPRP